MGIKLGFTGTRHGMTDAQPTPLTADEFNRIKERTGRLFMLYNLCAARKLLWHTDHLEVRHLMEHIDKHFPGNDLLVLLTEVDRLKGLSGPLPQAVTKATNAKYDTIQRRDREAEHQLLDKPVHLRTRTDVRYIQEHLGIVGGCCDSYANHSGCDCLERALPD